MVAMGAMGIAQLALQFLKMVGDLFVKLKQADLAAEANGYNAGDKGLSTTIGQADDAKESFLKELNGKYNIAHIKDQQVLDNLKEKTDAVATQTQIAGFTTKAEMLKSSFTDEELAMLGTSKSELSQIETKLKNGELEGVSFDNVNNALKNVATIEDSATQSKLESGLSGTAEQKKKKLQSLTNKIKNSPLLNKDAGIIKVDDKGNGSIDIDKFQSEVMKDEKSFKSVFNENSIKKLQASYSKLTAVNEDLYSFRAQHNIHQIGKPDEFADKAKVEETLKNMGASPNIQIKSTAKKETPAVLKDPTLANNFDAQSSSTSFINNNPYAPKQVIVA